MTIYTVYFTPPYHEILKQYFSDLLHDGYTERLPQYLEISHNSDLILENWLLHRGRLEYMIKLGKQHIRGLLESSDISNFNKMRVLN